jgi:two-component system, NarL family, sensor histidine kinase LiaS
MRLIRIGTPKGWRADPDYFLPSRKFLFKVQSMWLPIPPMKNHPRIPLLRRLSWKLTTSYALVTVATLMLAELCGLGGLGLIINNVDLYPRALSFLLSGAAQDLQPSLASTPPDIGGIRGWFSQVADGGVSFEAFGRYPVNFALDANTLANSRFYILDSRGNLLFSSPEEEALPTGKPFDVPDTPGLEEILRLALNGERNSGRLFVATDDPVVVAIAAPITDPDGTVRGALVMVIQNVAMVNTLGQLPGLLGLSFVCVGPVAVLVGLFFGFVTARGVTRRLGRMAVTASAWGRGDFSSTIRDKSADEIGQLAGELNRMSQQLQELIQTRQQLAGLEERNRLARDLHDSVKQQVFAISMNLGTVQTLWERDPAQARERLDAAMEQARQAQKELAVLIQTLRPIQMQGKGLVQALGEYLRDWQTHSGIQAEFHADEGITLPDEKEQTLFRVAQEALSNAARHSGAARVHVALNAQAGQVAMTVADDGRGFDPDKATGGFGLKSMRERVQSLGGTLEIRSGGNGTQITATLPL